jgi:hypothetical protein
MKKTGTFPLKIEVLLKCLPDAPFKKHLQAEIERLCKESYIQGHQDCRDVTNKYVVKTGKVW